MIPIKFENENILVDIVNKYQYKIESIIDRKHKKNGKKVSELIENELKKFCAFFEIESIAFSDLIKLPFSRIESLKEKIDKKYDECNNRFFVKCEDFNFYKFKVYYKDIFYDDKYGSEDSKNYGLAHINNLGVEVCPYCNIGYTFATPNKRLGEFDHFFSQDKYPIFALSFYNLIPVCHNCNHKKRENDLKLLSPFDSNLKYDTFKFFPKPKEQIGKFSIVLTNPNGNEKSALDALTNKDGLDLENVYEHISYVADNLYEKALFWNKYQLSSIKTLFDGKLATQESNLFNFLIDLRMAILADVSYSEKDYLKRSQSKILKDIADEFGIS